MKRIFAVLLCVIISLAFICACDVNSGLSGGTGNEIKEAESGDYIPGEEDYESDYDSGAAVSVVFGSSGATVSSSSAASVSGSTVTIGAEGEYVISGKSSSGQLIVDAKGKTVKLILNGLDLSSQNSAPIYIKKAEKVIITLEEGSENKIADSSATVTDTEGEPTAALFSKADLTINGSGSLEIDGNFNNALQSKDTLNILGGNLKINSVDDGIIGKDSVYIDGASIECVTDGDAVKSTNEDENLGVVIIKSGDINIDCGGDGITGNNYVSVLGAEITVKSGGGSSKTSYDSSAKGIKAGVGITVKAGTLNISSADDCVHSNNSINIEGGTLNLSSGDDGIHSDTVMVISGGDITVTKSYEGIESADITVSGGKISVVSSDDGINVAGGDGSSSSRPGQNSFNSSTNSALISGGEIYLSADGDGFDCNGSAEMTGGTMIIDGPVSDNNGAVDYDGTFVISGGTLLALGSTGMAMNPTSSSVYGFSATVTSSSGTAEIKDSLGSTLISHSNSKRFASVVFFSQEMTKGTYSVYINGALKTSVTVSSYLSSSGGGMGGGGMGGGGHR